jgi:chromosome segregation ATPase
MSRGGVKNLVSLVSDMREAAEAENNVPNTDVREPLSDKEMAAASKRVDAIKDSLMAEIQELAKGWKNDTVTLESIQAKVKEQQTALDEQNALIQEHCALGLEVVKELEGARAEIAALRAKHSESASSSDERAVLLATEVDTLKAIKSNLEQSLSLSKTKLAAAVTEKKGAEEELVKKKKIIVDLTTELYKREEQLEQFAAQLEEAASKRKDHQEKKGIEEELVKKKKIIVDLTTELYKREEQLKQFAAQLEEAASQQKGHQAAVDRSTTLDTQLAATMAELASVKARLATTERAWDDAKQSTEECKRDHASRLSEVTASLESQVLAKSKEVQTLKARVGKLLSTSQKDLRVLKGQLQEERKVREGAEKALAEHHHTHAHEANALNKDVTRLQEALASATAERDRLRDDVARLAPLEDALATATAERDRAQADVVRLAPLEEELAAVTATRARLDADLTRLRPFEEALASMKTERDGLKEEVARLYPLKEELQTVTEERDRVQGDVERLSTMKDMLESRFAEIAEQCQMILGDRNALRSENEKLIEKTQANEADLKKRETELKTAVCKLSAAEEAVEGELTCMECMNVFAAPTVCLPRGDTYCAKCVPVGITDTVANKQLATLAGKFLFMRQSIAAIKAMQKEREK